MHSQPSVNAPYSAYCPNCATTWIATCNTCGYSIDLHKPPMIPADASLACRDKGCILHPECIEKCYYALPYPNAVDHPSHYGGDTTYEAVKVIEAWELKFNLGNVV